MSERVSKFIVIEGQGFSGKTEQAKLLEQNLIKRNIPVLRTEEPGGVESAKLIRQQIMEGRANGSLTAEGELELFYKARERFLEELVKPSIYKGTWVLSTRFSASTFVYQGAEGGVDIKKIQVLEDKVVGDFQPDLYILLDVPEEEIISRLTTQNARNRHSFNEIDKEKITLRRKAYLDLARENKNKNWVIINGDQSIDRVSEDILNQIQRLF